jgi:hypothetical protein
MQLDVHQPEDTLPGGLMKKLVFDRPLTFSLLLVAALIMVLFQLGYLVGRIDENELPAWYQAIGSIFAIVCMASLAHDERRIEDRERRKHDGTAALHILIAIEDELNGALSHAHIERAKVRDLLEKDSRVAPFSEVHLPKLPVLERSWEPLSRLTGHRSIRHLIRLSLQLQDSRAVVRLTTNSEGNTILFNVAMGLEKFVSDGEMVLHSVIELIDDLADELGLDDVHDRSSGVASRSRYVRVDVTPLQN